MTRFQDLGLAEPVLRAVTAEGYDQPTPIQAGVIPALLQGRDVLGLAQTGTGKTAAFVLPLIDALARSGRQAPGKTCTTLILAPTRELAAQIFDSAKRYGRHVKPSLALVTGGVKAGPQVRAMARGVDILVATPGRLLDLMQSGAIRLDMTSTVILDEADQMLDLGFMPAIRKVMAALPAKRRTVLLSATLPGPIAKLAHEFLTNPVEVSVAPQGTPVERITQRVIHVPQSEKTGKLVELLAPREVERAIVFTRTKRGADKVARALESAGLPAAAIHGNKSQNQRNRALDGLKSGQVRILVATDIAARGIDVSDVSHVVNFELPNVPESYVHRIGRTARAGKGGEAISLCCGEETPLLRDIEKLTRMAIPAEGEPMAPPPGAKRPGGGGGGGRQRQNKGGGGQRQKQGQKQGQGQNRGQGQGGKAGGRKRRHRGPRRQAA